METLNGWLDPHLGALATAWVATLLVVVGADINRALKKRVGKRPFLVRVGAFVLLCAFGYGLLMFAGGWLLVQGLRHAVVGWARPLAMAVLFLILGILAERRHQL